MAMAYDAGYEMLLREQAKALESALARCEMLERRLALAPPVWCMDTDGDDACRLIVPTAEEMDADSFVKHWNLRHAVGPADYIALHDLAHQFGDKCEHAHVNGRIVGYDPAEGTETVIGHAPAQYSSKEGETRRA